MKKFVRDYFTFNKRERNGVFILLSIIALLVFYLNVSSHYVAIDTMDDPAFKEEVEEFRAAVESGKASEEEDTEPAVKMTMKKAAVEHFQFDPNHLSGKDWKRLGLSEKQIRSIRNYEEKGGIFRKKEDLKKMYCIRLEQYRSLEPYIVFGGNKERLRVAAPDPGKPAAASVKPVQARIELNSADSAQLTMLKGIGPFFARMIIKFRNSVGGFYAKEQLLEVWKFDAEKLTAIENSIEVDASKIRKVNINTCEAAALKNAYLSWNAANGIVNYRKNHGKYSSIDDIRRTDLVDEETYRKIAPYLVVDF